MDTKLKKFNHSKAVKSTVAVLAVVFFLIAGYYASIFAKGFFIYSVQSSDNYTQTYPFIHTLSWQDTEKLFSMLQVRSYGSSEEAVEEFINDNLDSHMVDYINDREKDALEAYNTLKKYNFKTTEYFDRVIISVEYNSHICYFDEGGNRMKRIGNDYFYCDSEEYAFDTTTTTAPIISTTAPVTDATAESEMSDDNPTNITTVVVEVSTIPGDEFYGRIIEHIETLQECMRVDISEETIKNDYKNQRISQLSTYYWEMYHSSLNAQIDIQNINYALIDREKGVVATNCGVVAEDTAEAILKKVGGDWQLSYVNGQTKITGGETTVAPNTYSLLYEEMLGSYDTSFEHAFGAYVEENYEVYYGAPVPVADVDTMDFYSALSYLDSNFRHTHLSGTTPSQLLTTALWTTVICLVLSLACVVFLMCVCGKDKNGEVTLSPLDKLWPELHLVLALGVMAACAAGVVGLIILEYDTYSFYLSEALWKLYTVAMPYSSTLTALLCGIFAACGLSCLLSFIRSIKAKKFFKSLLVYQLLRLLFKGTVFLCKKLWKLIRFLFGKIKKPFIHLYHKFLFLVSTDYSRGNGNRFKIISAAVIAGFLFINAWLCFAFGWESAEFLFFLFMIPINAVALLAALYAVVSIDRIMKGVHHIKQGELDYKIDTKYMPNFLKRFADDIATMQSGMQSAIEGAVRDQRMKAELITNVSHDLKTPLTSIVNYVDLLKRCEVENEDAKKYIDILEEKSQRMKKLIEDLVEASKASTGNIEIHPISINLCELMVQTVGEYTEELEKSGISLIYRAPENPVFILADGMKTSRIVENLFSNVKKYAMPDTRVFVDVSRNGNFGTVTIKNISKNPIDVSAEELTQRFVRGDASRSTEGSGLGLSIAESLCTLQNGKLEISVDGDLFKATVYLPLNK